MSDSGGSVVDPNPSTRCVSRAAEEGVGESGVATVDAGDRQGMLFSHEFVRSLLTFAGQVAVGELVAVKTLVSTAVRAIKDGEG